MVRVPAAPSWFSLRQVGDVTAVTFHRGPDAWDEAGVHHLRRQLFDLVGGRRFVLDLGGLDAVGSGTLGLLISFRKRVGQAGGSVALCSLGPGLTATFERTRLCKLFAIHADERDALACPPHSGSAR